MSKHYDSYGLSDREVYQGDPLGLMIMPLPEGHQQGEFRYIIWVYETPDRGQGYWKTYRTKFFALRRAQLLQEMGYGVQVRDREILPGDTGFLADRSGSYVMTGDGVLLTGDFKTISWLREVYTRG